MIRCPTSGKPVPVGISVDWASFNDAKISDEVLPRCKFCGGTHTWSKSDAWIQPGATG